MDGGEGPLPCWLIKGSCVSPAWLAEWSRKHPSGARPAYWAGRHVFGDRAAQSCDRARPARPAHAAETSVPGAWRPSSGLRVCARLCRGCWFPERPARRRAGGRRGSAACGRSRWWRSSSRAAWRSRRRQRRTPGTAWRSGPPGRPPPLLHRPLPGNVPVADTQVRAADGRGQPGPAGQLADASEAGDVTDLSHDHQRGELPDAGQRCQGPDPRAGLRVPPQLAVDPVDRRRQGAGELQAVGDDLPRHRGQVQLSQPATARPGPAR